MKTTTDMRAWLGPAAEQMNDVQIARFATEWGRVQQTWPDPDSQAERDAALSTAVQYLLGEADERDCGHQLATARNALVEAMAAARQAAVMAHDDGATEVDLAHDLGVDRARTLRRWLGKL